MAGCLCGCGRMALIRGLFRGCLESLRHRVNAGKTTWEAEIAAGRVLPAKVAGGKHWRNYPRKPGTEAG